MITIIRNHLIEHPYGAFKEFGGSQGAMSGKDGPMMLVRGPGNAPLALRPKQDPGLFANAAEFQNALHPVLEAALSSVGGVQPPWRERFPGVSEKKSTKKKAAE